MDRGILGLLVDIDIEDGVGVVAFGELMNWCVVLAAPEQRCIARLRPAYVCTRVRLLASIQMCRDPDIAGIAWKVLAIWLLTYPETDLVIRLTGFHVFVAHLLDNFGVEDVTRVDTLIWHHPGTFLIHVTAHRTALIKLRL